MIYTQRSVHPGLQEALLDGDVSRAVILGESHHWSRRRNTDTLETHEADQEQKVVVGPAIQMVSWIPSPNRHGIPSVENRNRFLS